eukprot:3101029-Heterocapsa_arctica.AAC.1
MKTPGRTGRPRGGARACKASGAAERSRSSHWGVSVRMRTREVGGTRTTKCTLTRTRESTGT